MAKPGFSIAAELEKRPATVLAAFLLLHMAVWTALPAVLYPNLPLDLIEALTYGREWQLGYDKLPPLPWWLVEATYRLIGYDFAYYLLAQIAVAGALAAVWATARPLAGVRGALAALLVIDGLHYLNFTAAKFNHDVIQLPFWALAGYAFHRGLRGGRIAHWLMLGLCIGILLWAKYFVVVLAVPLALFMLFDDEARKSLMTPGPYLAFIVALIVMAPHLVWLVQTDFLPFAYAESRAQPSRGLIDHLWHPLQFALGQIFFMLPAWLIALPLFWPRRGPAPKHRADAFDRRIVALLAFGPALTVAALSALSGRGTIAMWGYPLWLFLGLWLVLEIRHALDDKRLTRVAAAWAVVFTLFAAVFAASYTILPGYDHRYRAVFFPGDTLAQELSRRYRAATGKPMIYLISTMWEGGNVAHYAPEHPRVLIDGKPERAPWIDLKDLKAHGALVLWTDGDSKVLPPPYRVIAEFAQIQPGFDLPFRRGEQTLHVGWAILPPAPQYAGR